MQFAVKLLAIIGTYATSWTLAYVSVKRWDFDDFFPFLRYAWTTEFNGTAKIIQTMALEATLMVAFLIWYIPRVWKHSAKHDSKA